MQTIQVSVSAEGPVLVLRFCDEPGDASMDDQNDRLKILNSRLAAVDAELRQYQEEHGILVNVMLGHQVCRLHMCV
jgi:hypothetical protein